MSFTLKVNEDEYTFRSANITPPQPQECVWFVDRKKYYFAFQIAGLHFVIISAFNPKQLNKGIRREQFIRIKHADDTLLSGQAEMIKVNKINCGSRVERIAGDEETVDCRHFKKTLVINETAYLVDLSC